MPDDNQTTILEQYKMYVATAERVSESRLKTNQFYISVISGLLAVLTFISSFDGFSNLRQYENYMMITVGILGLLLNLVWVANIHSYRQLNRGKFKVIHEMETLLPFKPFYLEWQMIRHGQKEDRYRQLTRVEPLLPCLLAVPFLVLIIITLI